LTAFTIQGVNRLSETEKRRLYAQLIPPELVRKLDIPPTYIDKHGRSLLSLNCPSDSASTEMSLYHEFGFPDPVLYGHITDTLHGQVHVLLYVLNDPHSQRFDVDRMPDGSPTHFGTVRRNLDAELAAMRYGLAPGQIRSGMRMLGEAIQAFELFVSSLDREIYFTEPLYYHNAVIFERYGFAYERGRRFMERIQAGFDSGGEFIDRLGSSPFRPIEAKDHIRLRSWAIHDGLLGEPYTNVTMYKRIGVSAGVTTCTDCEW
jgi:acetoin utilization protein AcuC